MKVAIAFLAVALSCYFESGSATIPVIPDDCLLKLIESDLPGVSLRLKNLLCLCLEAENENNVEKFREFLEQLHQALTDVGCVADQILSLDDFLAAIGDDVGEAAKQIATRIFKLVDGLPLVDDVLNFTCDVLNKTLKEAASLLGFIKCILGFLGLGC